MTAHIRTIKPGFFLDDEIAELSYPARLLYIGLWCQADREGRLEDRPKRIKAECLPYDDVDVEALLDELVLGDFVTRYKVGDRAYMHVRTFLKHQRPNQREPQSTIPAPAGSGNAHARTCTDGADTCDDYDPHMHADADTDEDDARTQGREGKGREEEGKGKTRGKRATAFPDDFSVTSEMRAWAARAVPSVDTEAQTARFRDYCLANGKTYKDWAAAWRNWMGNAVTFAARATVTRFPTQADHNSARPGKLVY